MLENYEIDRFGVVHQIDFTPIQYDEAYIWRLPFRIAGIAN